MTEPELEEPAAAAERRRREYVSILQEITQHHQRWILVDRLLRIWLIGTIGGFLIIMVGGGGLISIAGSLLLGISMGAAIVTLHVHNKEAAVMLAMHYRALQYLQFAPTRITARPVDNLDTTLGGDGEWEC